MVKRTTTKKKVARVNLVRFRVEDLHVPEYNNRVITDAALEGLEQSLTDFGLLSVPVVNVRDGRNVVVGGNQRLAVLRDSGVEEVTCIAVEMSDADERVANFTLNSPAIQGEFVPTLLRDVMARIREAVGEDHEKLFKRLRFDVLYRSVMRNLARSAEGRAEPRAGRVADDDVPSLTLTEPDSKVGQFYSLGAHTLYCGTLADVPTLAGFNVEHADMAFARFAHAEPYRDSYLDLYLAAALNNTNGAVYLATSLDRLAAVQHRFQVLGGHWSTTLMAYEPKRSGRKGETYRDIVTPVLYGWRDDVKHFFYGGRDKSNLVALADRASRGDVPVELATYAMLNSSSPGAVVLDVHVARGSTVIAAEKYGRRLIGYVRSPRGLDRVRDRWTRFVHGERADWRSKTGVAT